MANSKLVTVDVLAYNNEKIKEQLDKKIDVQQNVADANKLLGIGVDGKVLPVEAPSSVKISAESDNQIEQKEDGLYVGKQYIELSQSEYEALGDKVNSDNVIYYIEDGASDEVTLVTELNDTASDTEIPTAKAVCDEINGINESLEVKNVISKISLINGVKFADDTGNNSSFAKVGNMCVFNLQLDTSQLTDLAIMMLPEELLPKALGIQRPFVVVDYEGNSYIAWLANNGVMAFASERDYPKKYYVVLSGMYPC